MLAIVVKQIVTAFPEPRFGDLNGLFRRDAHFRFFSVEHRDFHNISARKLVDTAAANDNLAACRVLRHGRHPELNDFAVGNKNTVMINTSEPDSYHVARFTFGRPPLHPSFASI